MKSSRHGASPCWHAFCVAHFSQSRLALRRLRKNLSVSAQLAHDRPRFHNATRPDFAHQRTRIPIGRRAFQSPTTRHHQRRFNQTDAPARTKAHPNSDSSPARQPGSPHHPVTHSPHHPRLTPDPDLARGSIQELDHPTRSRRDPSAATCRDWPLESVDEDRAACHQCDP